MKRFISNSLLICMLGLNTQGHAETYKQGNQRFLVCMEILHVGDQFVDKRLHDLRESGMDISPEGWVPSDIMYDEQQNINRYMYNFQMDYYKNNNGDPETCRQRVIQYIQWIDNKVTQVMSIH